MNKPSHALEPGWHLRAAHNAEDLRALYLKLDELATGQQALLDPEHTQDLLDLLTRRSGLIDQIKSLTEQLQPVMDSWDRLGASVPEPAREAICKAIGDIGMLNEAILLRDNHDTGVLVEHKSRIAGELASIDRGRAAVSAYSGRIDKQPQTPHFQDRQG